MTRSEKVRKLANAIRDYRGITSTPVNTPADEVKWKKAPHQNDLPRVFKWLTSLGLDATSAVKEIDGFKTFAEFRQWIAAL